MDDCCMYVLYGEKLECSAPSTIPTLFKMLSSGKPIHGTFLVFCQFVINIEYLSVREWTKGMWKILEEGVPAIWEVRVVICLYE